MAAQPVPEVSYLLFEDLLPTIDRILRQTIRRRWLKPDDGDELRSFVYGRLLDNESAILRKHRGESSWKTYLTVVIQRLFLDFRDHQWGKWRPSSRAKAAGEVGVLLDRLTSRDGHSVAEAIRILVENYGVTTPEEKLWRLAAELPQHGRPMVVGEDFLAEHCSSERTEEETLAAERAAHLRTVFEVVKSSLEALPAEDKLVLEMRFFDNVQIRQIARALNLPPKPLYRRIEKLLGQLRLSLETQGCFWQEIEWLFQTTPTG